MKTRITIEWEGKTRDQTHTNDNGDIGISPFLNCIIGDALKIFRCERSGHNVQEVSIQVSGYKVTISEQEES